MKRYILLGLTLLMALPQQVSAQTSGAETGAKRAESGQKKYETRVVRGQVIDAATGKPVEGAIVKASGIKGFSVLTDEKGCYELNVPVFASAIQIVSPDHNLLSLGLTAGEKQKTAELLYSAFSSDYGENLNVLSSPSATDFKFTSAVNVKEEVQNRLGAYAYSVNRSGMPGVGSVTFIQGLNSLNANAQPLVVVDGVILEQQYDREMLHHGFYNDILSAINPTDIEEVTIIRNGTALYGARGANGVINIRTKRSNSLTTKITANVSGGVTTEPRFISMMNADEYRGYASELLGTTKTQINNFKFLNADPDYYYYKQYHNNTDWKDYVYRTAVTQNYGINVEGGDDVAKYNLSIGYLNKQSNLECNDMGRLNIRFNTDIRLLEKLSVRFDASFSNTTRDIRDDGAPLQYDEGTPTAPSFMAYAKSPFLSPYAYGNGMLSKSYLDVTDESYLDEALGYYSNYNYKLGNPVAFNEYAEAENKNRFENSLLNIIVSPKYDFTPNLSLTELFSYSLVNTNNRYFIPINGVPTYYVKSVSGFRENEVRSLASKQNSVMSDTRLDWTRRFDAHDIQVMGGVRVNFETYTRNSQLGYDTGSDKTPFMSKSLKNAQSSGDNDKWRNLDVYAQGNYSYLGRYYAQVNLTASGSSRFGKDADGGVKVGGVVWGIFPSVQASWVLTNEPWLANVKWLDYLRLTAGYDISGNDGIDYYASRSYFRAQMYLNSLSGLSFSSIGNTKIKWETTQRLNAGIEGNFLGNRLHAAANFFHSTTSDLLSLQSLGFLSGLEKNWANAGELQNTGMDVILSGKLIAKKNWSWELGVSVGHYENQIKSLADGQQFINTDLYGATIRTEVGKAANLFYGYKTNGVFATSEQAAEAKLYVLDSNGIDLHFFGAGDMIFADVNPTNANGKNAPGQIDENDRVVIGNPNPDIYGNIFTTLTWKRLKLDVNVNYSLGNDVYNYMRSQLEGGNRFFNQTTAMTQRWQMEGQVTSVPKVSFQDPMGNSRFSDRWIEDGSYLRLKAVTLSYDLPINSQFLQGLQFWIQGNNLLTCTKYLGSDPEFSAVSSVIGQGIDLGRIGFGRSFMAGIKINL